MSNTTTKYRNLKKTFLILSILLTILPMAIAIISAFVNGTKVQKTTLGCCVTVAFVLVMINIILKKHIRSALWVALLGIYFCFDNLKPLLFIMAITTIIDEFIIYPLYKKYKNQYVINKEIDKRGIE